MLPRVLLRILIIGAVIAVYLLGAICTAVVIADPKTGPKASVVAGRAVIWPLLLVALGIREAWNLLPFAAGRRCPRCGVHRRGAFCSACGHGAAS